MSEESVTARATEYFRIRENPEYIEAIQKVYEAQRALADAELEVALVIKRLKGERRVR